MNTLSRMNPSARYQALLQMYRSLHDEGEKALGYRPEDTFSGVSLSAHIGRVKEFVQMTGSQNLLDYGSGKGRLYDLRDIPVAGSDRLCESIQDYWELDFIQCFDPAYGPFSVLPQGRFHGVICVDVLEHCPEDDLPWILEEIFGFADRFVYLTIASYPAEKTLPNGENAHITLRAPEWWDALLKRVAALRPQLVWEACVDLEARVLSGFDPRLERRLGNAPRGC